MFLKQFKIFPVYVLLMLFALIAIASYKLTFSALTVDVIIYHIFLVFVGANLLTTLGVFLKYFKIEIPKIYAFMWSIFYLFLTVIYLSAFVGTRLVGTPLSIQIIKIYFFQLSDVLTAIGSPILLTYFALVLFILFYPVVFVCFSDRIWNKLTKNLESLCGIKNRLVQSIFLITLAVSIFLFATDFFRFTNFNSRLFLAKEPIYLVFTPKKSGNVSLAKNIELTSIATNYPKGLDFEKKNVVLIIVDDLRADYLPIYGCPENISPFLTQLVNDRGAIKVENVFANSSASFSGILSILTSKLWTHVAQKNFALQDVLKKQGYQINFILSGDHTSFFALRDTYGENIDFYYDGLTSKSDYVNDDNVVLRGLKDVPLKDTLANFFYVHLMSTHSVGKRKPENLRYKPANAIGDNAQEYENNYKNGIIQTDRYIEKIFELLEQRNLLSNSVIVITADHGESLGERNLFGHGNGVYNNEILIPLIIYDSDKRYKYYLDNAIQEDLAPTILDRLGLPIPTNFEGESLLKLKKDRQYSYHHYFESFAIISYKKNGLIKYLFNPTTNVEQIFNLEIDMQEKSNIIKIFPKQELLVLRGLMKEFISETKN